MLLALPTNYVFINIVLPDARDFLRRFTIRNSAQIIDKIKNINAINTIQLVSFFYFTL